MFDDERSKFVQPLSNKTYKVFLVEEDDEDRARVIAGRAKVVEINTHANYDDVISDHSMSPVYRYQTHTDYTINLTLEPDENGHYLHLENFNVPDVVEEAESLGDEDSIYD